MSESSETYGFPAETSNPRLVSSELQPICKQMAASSLEERDWLAERYQDDPDFRMHITAFEASYAQLAVNGLPSEQVILELIDCHYARDAIQRQAAFMADPLHQSLLPHTLYDVLFAEYLDRAMPLASDNSVTVSGEPSWAEYILEGADSLFGLE
jgi:hypothetical protein